jgi:hypothetical protein
MIGIGVLEFIAAYCGVRYLQTSFTYSAILGVASEANRAQLAHLMAWFYLSAAILLVAGSAVLVSRRFVIDVNPTLISRLGRFGGGFLISLSLATVMSTIWIYLRR